MATTRWLCVLIFAVSGLPLLAQNQFTVTTVADSGAGSLRQAIIDANALPNQVVSMVSVPDEIRFQSGVTGTITLATSLPQVTEGLSIIGPGRTLLTVSGANTLRIIDSQLGTYMAISRMTLANALADGDGGAIFSRGWTVISDVAFNNCHAVGASSGSGPGVAGRGGAIYHEPLVAELWVTNSLFDGCSADGGNGTTGNGGAGQGGAIFLSNGVGRFSLSTFQNCAATGGDTTTSGSGGQAAGGAIYADSVLDLDDVVITASSATGGITTTAAAEGGRAYGGGIRALAAIDAQRLEIASCSATGGAPGAGGSSGEAGGGGLHSDAGSGVTVELRLAVIELCSAASASGFSFGGAIAVDAIFNLIESHIDQCTAGDSGGGIHNEGSDNVQLIRSTISGCTGSGISAIGTPSFIIQNSTISGNDGGTATGGIDNSGAVMQISFSTITANTGATWGGVYRTSGTLTIIGSIVAGNTGSGASADIDAQGSMTIQNSVVGIQDPAAVAVNGTNGNQVGSVGTPLNAMLASLTTNGGPTPTHALLAGSPAINMGGAVGVPSTDQRNAVRDQGVADAGSYEFGASPPNTGGNAGAEGDARCSTSAGGFNWLALLGLLATLGLVVRLRRA
ncbi:MAG: right-handed parallel beta-helix repeat-containing protein [Planctomycetes bacterium]|nr:right-handed parallel beta-helix repeat-containing protein [Planctomycetota bacterium]